MGGNQVRKAPSILRFVNIYGMTALDELHRDTTQKMRVPMVPIRNQRMIKHHDFHAATSSNTSGGLAVGASDSTRRQALYAPTYSFAILCVENAMARARARLPKSSCRRGFSINPLRALMKPDV